MADLLADADAVHRYLVRHNLRAVPGNLDGQGLYGLPATMNGTGYERKGTIAISGDLASLRRTAQQLRASRDLTGAMQLEEIIRRREAETDQGPASGLVSLNPAPPIPIDQYSPPTDFHG